MADKSGKKIHVIVLVAVAVIAAVLILLPLFLTYCTLQSYTLDYLYLVIPLLFLLLVATYGLHRKKYSRQFIILAITLMALVYILVAIFLVFYVALPNGCFSSG
jgi:membrane protease YdiL (CAAX protease family)